jgi:hypothetical protein
MNIEYANNPEWADEEHTMINLIVKWEHLSEAHPFTASLSDPEKHGKKLFQDAVAGNYGEIKEFTPVNENPPSELVFPTPASDSTPVTIIE